MQIYSRVNFKIYTVYKVNHDFVKKYPKREVIDK